MHPTRAQPPTQTPAARGGLFKCILAGANHLPTHMDSVWLGFRLKLAAKTSLPALSDLAGQRSFDENCDEKLLSDRRRWRASLLPCRLQSPIP